MIGADLMSEAARARVNEDGDLIEREAERPRRCRIEDRLHALDLEKVIAAAQAAELVSAPLLRALGDRRGASPREAPPASRRSRSSSTPSSSRRTISGAPPSRTAIEIRSRELETSAVPVTGRDAAHELVEHGLYRQVLTREVRRE